MPGFRVDKSDVVPVGFNTAIEGVEPRQTVKVEADYAHYSVAIEVKYSDNALPTAVDTVRSALTNSYATAFAEISRRSETGPTVEAQP